MTSFKIIPIHKQLDLSSVSSGENGDGEEVNRFESGVFYKETPRSRQVKTNDGAVFFGTHVDRDGISSSTAVKFILIPETLSTAARAKKLFVTISEAAVPLEVRHPNILPFVRFSILGRDATGAKVEIAKLSARDLGGATGLQLVQILGDSPVDITGDTDFGTCTRLALKSTWAARGATISEAFDLDQVDAVLIETPRQNGDLFALASLSGTYLNPALAPDSSIEPRAFAKWVGWIIRELAAGTEAAHLAGRIVNDNKLENGLIDMNINSDADSGDEVQGPPRVYVADFGWFGFVSDPRENNGQVGTREYIPPQEWDEYITPKSDVYMLCLMGFELIFGHQIYGIVANRVERQMRFDRSTLPQDSQVLRDQISQWMQNGQDGFFQLLETTRHMNSQAPIGQLIAILRRGFQPPDQRPTAKELSDLLAEFLGESPENEVSAVSQGIVDFILSSFEPAKAVYLNYCFTPGTRTADIAWGESEEQEMVPAPDPVQPSATPRIGREESKFGELMTPRSQPIDAGGTQIHFGQIWRPSGGVHQAVLKHVVWDEDEDRVTKMQRIGLAMREVSSQLTFGGPGRLPILGLQIKGRESDSNETRFVRVRSAQIPEYREFKIQFFNQHGDEVQLDSFEDAGPGSSCQLVGIKWDGLEEEIGDLVPLDMMNDIVLELPRRNGDLGSLSNLLRKAINPLRKPDAVMPFSQFVTYVMYVGLKVAETYSDIHKQGGMVVDGKGANILVHHKFKPGVQDITAQEIVGLPEFEIADFGQVRHEEPDVPVSLCGTPLYRPPAFMEFMFTQKTDVYTWALTVFELLTGRLPYDFNVRVTGRGKYEIKILHPVDTIPELEARVKDWMYSQKELFFKLFSDFGPFKNSGLGRILLKIIEYGLDSVAYRPKMAEIVELLSCHFPDDAETQVLNATQTIVDQVREYLLDSGGDDSLFNFCLPLTQRTDELESTSTSDGDSGYDADSDDDK